MADRDLPGLCVAMRWFGVRSEVWAWRQIRLFSRLRPEVLSWTHKNAEDFPLGEIPLRMVGTEEEPNDGGRRWAWRLGNLRGGNFYGSQGGDLARFVSLLSESRPAVILCHFGHVGLRLLPVARRLGIPLVVHFHGQDISSGLGNRWYRWSLRRGLPDFAAAVCVGSHQRERLIRLGMPEERIHLIPCGVPTGEFAPAPRKSGQAGARFICVSRLVEWKGQHLVVEAFGRIADEMPGSRLVVVGDGPDMELLKRQAAESGLGGSVEFTGAIPAAAVREALGDADVFVQHSLTHRDGWDEGFGVSIAEASAMELPVVVSRCGGITDQVVDGETGLLVAERDVSAMAAAMLRLAGDPELRRRMGRAGRRRMAEHFDTGAQVRKLEDVLLSAARSGP